MYILSCFATMLRHAIKIIYTSAYRNVWRKTRARNADGNIQTGPTMTCNTWKDQVHYELTH